MRARFFIAAACALAWSACYLPIDPTAERIDPDMPQTLTAESPLIWPTPMTVPADSDSPLASGELKTALKKLADRTDHLHSRALIHVAGRHEIETTTGVLLGTATAPTAVWTAISATGVVVPNLKTGDKLEIEAHYRLKAVGANSVRGRLSYNGGSASGGVALPASTREAGIGTGTMDDDVYRVFRANYTVPADRASTTILVEILPDGADNAELWGFGGTYVTVYRAF